MPKPASVPVNLKVLKKLTEICLELPEAIETMSWGKPHFKISGKIFCGYREEEDGRSVIGLLLEMGHAQQIVEDPRFWLVGNKGGVCIDISNVTDWKEVKNLVTESYYLMAPKHLAEQVVEANQSGKSKQSQSSAKKKPVSKPVSAKAKSASSKPKQK